MRINLAETGFEPDPNTYMTLALGDAAYVRKAGDSMTGLLYGIGATETSDSLQFTARAATAAGIAGLRVQSNLGTRMAELLYLGAAAGSAYGAAANDVVLNVGSNFIIATLDALRMAISSSGNVSVGASSVSVIGSGADRFAVNGSIGINGQINALPGIGLNFEIVNRSSGGIVLYTNVGTKRAVDVAPSGYMGINQPIPGARLDVRQDSATPLIAIFDSQAVNGGYVQFMKSTVPIGYAGSLAPLKGSGSASDFALRADNALVFLAGGAFESMRIMSSGPVCINATSNTSIGAGTDPFAVNGTIGVISQVNFLPGSTNPAQLVNRSPNGGFDFVVDSGSAYGLRISSAGVLTDISTLELGWRDIPPNTSFADGATLTLAARGKCVAGNYSSLTVPASTFKRGDSFAVYQDGAGSMSLTQGGGLTMRLAGSATTGTRTLAGRGMATLWFNSASEVIVSGAGVT